MVILMTGGKVMDNKLSKKQIIFVLVWLVFSVAYVWFATYIGEEAYNAIDKQFFLMENIYQKIFGAFGFMTIIEIVLTNITVNSFRK